MTRQAGRRAVLSAALAAVALGAGAPAAGAATSCAFDAATASVTVTMRGNATARIAKTPGGAIGVNNAACGAATAANTDGIKVIGDSWEQKVRLALTTRLGPGKTSEGTVAASEIEVVAQLAGGPDRLELDGGPAADTWTLGTGGADLNADADGDDVRWSGVEYIQLGSRAGDDVLSLAGSAATGAPLRVSGTIYAGQGADVVTGSIWYDGIHGDADEDRLAPATGGADRLSGGEGVDALTGGPGDDSISGGEESDHLCGGPGDDRLSGGEGADVFEWQGPLCDAPGGGNGADVIAGGAGAGDRIDYGSRTEPVSFTPGTLANDGVAGEGDTVGRDVEDAVGGSGDDRLDGSAIEAPHVLAGGGGTDTLIGGAAADKLTGGAGDDLLRGGGEIDTIDGNDGADTLRGGDGGDLLSGGADADSLYGEAGLDKFELGLQRDGADLVSGGTGFDYVRYYRSTSTRVSLDNVANDGEDAAEDGVAEEGDNVRVDVESVTTYDGDDFLTADTAAANAVSATNYLVGGAGSDRIEGGAGNDVLRGDDATYYWTDGDDTLIGGSGGDEMSGGPGDDTFGAKDGEFDHVHAGDSDLTDGDTAEFDPFDDLVGFRPARLR